MVEMDGLTEAAVLCAMLCMLHPYPCSVLCSPLLLSWPVEPKQIEAKGGCASDVGVSGSGFLIWICEGLFDRPLAFGSLLPNALTHGQPATIFLSYPNHTAMKYVRISYIN